MIARMAWLMSLLMVLGLLLFGGSAAEQDMEAQMKKLTEQMETTLDKMLKMVDKLSRQVMMQQLFMEERIRSDGGSGVKQSRQVTQGTHPYHADTANGGAIAAVHEHPSVLRTCGSGEFVAVLNGVEFRTRHNDYQFFQSEEVPTAGGKIPYDAVRYIPLPDVPPEVNSKGTVEEQIQEMREWFKAWKDQDHSVRDYRQYFKPIICILEGGWIVPNGSQIEEPFDSLRHYLDASTWQELQDKIRFSSASGRKTRGENFAFLPTTIISTGNGTVEFAQWNYRIVCHPLNRDLPTKHLVLIDDITSRIAFGRTMEQHFKTPAARFRIAPENKDDWKEKLIKGDMLDDLMAQIPGKDGYGNELLDEWLDGDVAKDLKTRGNLSAGYYHRWFKATPGGMGSQIHHRAFSDENLFMAKTTQEKIAPTSLEQCTGEGENQTCTTHTERWTYAVPLDLFYLTPLHSWNPYNLSYWNSIDIVTNGGNLTGNLRGKALNGTHQNKYYRTPAKFFRLSTMEATMDGGREPIWVMDSNGVARQVLASGTWNRLPEIEGIGKLRMRYPIMPLHYEGSADWKELTALKDIILQPEYHRNMFYTQNQVTEEPSIVTLMMETSQWKLAEPHTHIVYVNRKDLESLDGNYLKTLKVTSEEANGHSHTLTIMGGGGKFVYTECDDMKDCWDKHPRKLDIVEGLRLT